MSSTNAEDKNLIDSDELNCRFDQFEKKLEGSEGRFDQFEEELKGSKERFKQFEEELKGSKEIFDQFEKTLERINDIEKESKQGDLPRDIFSLLYFDDNENEPELHFSWKVVAFVVSEFSFQISMLVLVLFNLLDYSRQLLPFLNPPPDVEWYVRLAQYFAVVVAIWTQDDLIECIQLFNYGKGLVYSALMKLSVGFLSLIISLIFIVQSSNIVDMFANFAAMAFISLFDNVLFVLIENGVITPSLRERVQLISKATIGQKEKEESSTRRRWSFLITLYMFVAFPLIYTHIKQQRGDYLSHSIDVYVGEDSGDKNAISQNGEYVTNNNDKHNGRPVYYNKNCLNHTEFREYPWNCSKVIYCNKRWNWPECYFNFARSERTNSFEVSLVEDWSYWSWSPIHQFDQFNGAEQILSSFSITSNKCVEHGDCGEDYRTFCENNKCVCDGYLGPKCQGPIPCEELVTDIGKSFPNYSNSFKLLHEEDQYINENDNDNNNEKFNKPFLFMGRPIYYDFSIQSEMAIIYFTGSRWVLTKEYYEDSIFNQTHIIKYFQSQRKYCNERFGYDCWYGHVNPSYVSQETFDYSPAGLAWNRWPMWTLHNEKQEDALFGAIEPVESILLCKECRGISWENDGEYDTNDCHEKGQCSYDGPSTCECYDGWFGIKCHVPSVSKILVQVTFQYSGSSKCMETATFDSTPFHHDLVEDLSIDIVPPLKFGESSSVGLFMTKNSTHMHFYQSSCNSTNNVPLKTVKLAEHNNGTKDYVTNYMIDHHDELYLINSSGVEGIPPTHEYCEETYSSTVPEIFLNTQSERRKECSDVDGEEDPKIKNLDRLMVSLKFDTVVNSPFGNNR